MRWLKKRYPEPYRSWYIELWKSTSRKLEVFFTRKQNQGITVTKVHEFSFSYMVETANLLWESFGWFTWKPPGSGHVYMTNDKDFVESALALHSRAFWLVHCEGGQVFSSNRWFPMLSISISMTGWSVCEIFILILPKYWFSTLTL